MTKRVTNQDLDKRLTVLETEFGTVKAGLKIIMAMVGTALAGILVQIARTFIK